MEAGKTTFNSVRAVQILNIILSYGISIDPTRYEVIGRKYFQPNIDPIDSQELTNIFKTLLKEKFIEFELDIQFLITKVIMASVDINVLGLSPKIFSSTKEFVGDQIHRHFKGRNEYISRTLFLHIALLTSES